MKIRRLIRVSALLLVAGFGPGCGKSGGGSGGAVDITLPAGVVAPSVALEAEPVADLAPLKAFADGQGVLAAARWPVGDDSTPAK